MKNFIEILIFVEFVKKNIESDKIKDHCHLTRKNRGPAHNKCTINVTQEQSNLIQLHFTFLVFMVVIFFLKSWSIKNDKIQFKIIPKTNEDYICVTYGCLRFIDSYPIL